jgi:hypothetical protein
VTGSELAEVVGEIADAVDAAGYPDRSAWLRERATVLRSGDAESCARAKVELASVVRGMGGLTDIYYGPGGERMKQMIDRLWAAVKQ